MNSLDCAFSIVTMIYMYANYVFILARCYHRQYISSALIEIDFFSHVHQGSVVYNFTSYMKMNKSISANRLILNNLGKTAKELRTIERKQPVFSCTSDREILRFSPCEKFLSHPRYLTPVAPCVQVFFFNIGCQVV